MIGLSQLPNSKIAEHLANNVQECSSMQEILHSVYTSSSDINDTKLKEFELEFERLQAKIDNLKSQNDVLSLTLEESKAMTDRLSVLMGKY